MKLDQPMFLAREIASLLDSDPIACAQVKEHLPIARLLELFTLPPIQTETVREAVDNCELEEDEFEEYFRDAAIETMTDDELLDELRKRKITKAEILSALNQS